MQKLFRTIFGQIVMFLLISIVLYFLNYLLGLLMDEQSNETARQYLEILQKVILTLFWLVASWLIAKLCLSLFINPIFKLKVDREAPGIIASLFTIVFIGITLSVAIANIWAVALGGLMATSGVITLVAGLAMREVIMDFFSGIALNVERPYKLGDWLQVADNDKVGQVVEVNWRAIHLCLNDKRVIVIPNSQLASSSFINYSKNPTYRENLGLVFRYDIEPKRVENILMSAILATPGVVENAKHRVRINSFSQQGVHFDVKYWISDYGKLIPIKHALSSNILLFLDRAGILLPYFTYEAFESNSMQAGIKKRFDNERILKKTGLFNSLSNTEIAIMATNVHGNELNAGAEVIREGDEGDSLYVVVEGFLQVSIKGEKVGQACPSEVFGEGSLLTGAPRGATVVMVTGGYLIEVKKSDLAPLMIQRPEIAESLAKDMVRRESENNMIRDASAQDGELTTVDKVKELGARIRTFFVL
jgi:small-conductance mechanosensitive channel